jgi:hypothetical protein
MRLEERLRQCKVQGNKAEHKFKELMDAKGRFCMPSYPKQNMEDHIDFFVDDVGIDVKGNRKLDCIWLELNNVQGKPGWLRGKADFIVMDIKELKGFYFFPRIDLLDYCSNITETAKHKFEYNKLYTRHGRKDLLVQVRYNDIKHLQKGFIKYG